MIVTVIVVGRVRASHLAPAVLEYETRAGRYWRLTIEEVDAGSGRGDVDRVRTLEVEGDRILRRIPDSSEVVALTRDGKGMSSEQLASLMGDIALHSGRGLCFVIGGAYGLDSTVLERANRRLSLSAMTLPHEAARLILAEQLYRAGTILRNEPYHKGGGR